MADEIIIVDELVTTIEIAGATGPQGPAGVDGAAEFTALEDAPDAITANGFVRGSADGEELVFESAVMLADESTQVTAYHEYLGSRLGIANGSAGRHVANSESTSGKTFVIPDFDGFILMAPPGEQPSISGMVPISDGSGPGFTIRQLLVSDIPLLESELNARPEVLEGELFTVELGDLADVTFTAEANNDVVVFDNGVWVNKTLAAAGIAAASHTQAISTITGLQTALDSLASAITTLDGEFDTHNHTSTDVTDFNEAAVDAVASVLTEGTGVSIEYDDTANTITISASGGGSSNVLTASKSVDQTKTSDGTLADDADLQITVEANTTYRYEFHYLFDCDSAERFQFGLSLPSGATARMTPSVSSSASPQNQSTVSNIAGNGVGVERLGSQHGIIRINATAGTVAIQWSQVTPGVLGTTLRATSLLILTKID